MNAKAKFLILAASLLATRFLTGCKAPPPVFTLLPLTVPQSAAVGTAFASPLSVVVADQENKKVSGVSVTFTAPATGASGTFQSTGSISETDTTDANGVAVSSTFTANGTANRYSVSASNMNAKSPANFSLTNTVGPPASISASGGTPQSAQLNTAFANPLAATVTDSFNNVLGGVAVTFTAPSTGPSGTFASNSSGTETDTTNSSGVATSSAFTANAAAGSFTVSATAPGAPDAANFQLINTTSVVASSSTYVFYLSGWETLNESARGSNLPNLYSLAGSVTVDAHGNVLGGEQDYNDGLGITATDTILPAPVALSVDPGTGQGSLILTTNDQLLGPNGSGVEVLGVQFVNAKHALIVQFDGSATSSGSFDFQTLPGALSGNFAFTLSETSWVPSSYAGFATSVEGGVFSIAGNSLTGVYDYNLLSSLPNFQQTLNGIVSPHDSFGRGTLTGLGGTVAYYIVAPEVLRFIDIDAADTGLGSAFGQGSAAGSFNSASLGNSVFTVSDTQIGNYDFAALGMLATVPGTGAAAASGTFQGVVDWWANLFDFNFGSAISGTYSIAGNGYGSINFALNTATEHGDDLDYVGLYMTDPQLNLNDPNNTTSGRGGALLIDFNGDSVFIGPGIATPQSDSSPSDFSGKYAFAAQGFGDGNAYGFDLVGQGTATVDILAGAVALSGNGYVNDLLGPVYASFEPVPADQFSGAASPDLNNPGRSTMSLFISAAAHGSPVDAQFNVFIYQASGGQLYWLGQNSSAVFVGPIEQQGSLTGMPGALRSAPHSAKPTQLP